MQKVVEETRIPYFDMLSISEKHSRVSEELFFIEKKILSNDEIVNKVSDKLMFSIQYKLQDFNEPLLVESGYKKSLESTEDYVTYQKYIDKESIFSFFSIDYHKQLIYFTVNI